MTFGDFEDDDAFDVEPADPEQVARKLHGWLRDDGLELADWDVLDLAEQTLRIIIAARLLSWLRLQGGA